LVSQMRSGAESVCAVVVLREGYQMSEAGLIEFCAERLSGYKKPKKIVFMNELPKNAAGKVTKNVLREPFWAGGKKFKVIQYHGDW